MEIRTRPAFVHRLLQVIGGLALMLLAGCAGVETQRAHDLSSAGVAYSAASQALVDAAMNAAADADSFSKVATKPRPGATKAPEAQLTKELADSDAQLVITLTRYQQLRTEMATLGAYFAALQELADHPQGEATGNAVKTLAERVNELDGVLTKDKELALTDAQITALSGLAKLVSDQIHGAIVAAALKRDAVTIGRALAISRKGIRLAEKDVSGYLRLKQDAFYREKVKKPYLAQSIDDQWIDDRRVYLRGVALGTASADIAKAEAASAQMQATWEKVLAGDLSAAELHKMVGEINQLLGAAATLKAAEHPKTPPAP